MILRNRLYIPSRLLRTNLSPFCYLHVKIRSNAKYSTNNNATVKENSETLKQHQQQSQEAATKPTTKAERFKKFFSVFSPPTTETREQLKTQGSIHRDRLDPKDPFETSKAGSTTPTEIKLKRAERVLEVTFENGNKFRFPAEFLRVESPSAEVQGYGALGQKKLVYGRRNVGIINIEPVGNYGIRIIFDDMHDTGIYSWRYLHELGERKYSLMRRYIIELRNKGLSRSAPPRSSRPPPASSPASSQTPPSPPNKTGE